DAGSDVPDASGAFGAIATAVLSTFAAESDAVWGDFSGIGQCERQVGEVLQHRGGFGYGGGVGAGDSGRSNAGSGSAGEGGQVAGGGGNEYSAGSDLQEDDA